jgi:RNA-directed DNA polymerase
MHHQRQIVAPAPGAQRLLPGGRHAARPPRSPAHRTAARGTKARLECLSVANLTSLLHRFKSGTYYAPPVRRVYIPKDDGKAFRPIGIPSFEDKVLQRAVAMVLETVYEQDFLDCSYGFRPKRSPHQALDAFWRETMRMKGGWVIKIDIKSYFDTISHRKLRVILDKRVRDGVIRRTIDKWLKAGVLENGCVKHSETGVPQGSGVAPILSNLFLHEVLDTWFEQEVKLRPKGAPHCVDLPMTPSSSVHAKAMRNE